jgi:hypothetical protein
MVAKLEERVEGGAVNGLVPVDCDPSSDNFRIAAIRVLPNSRIMAAHSFGRSQYAHQARKWLNDVADLPRLFPPADPVPASHARIPQNI